MNDAQIARGWAERAMNLDLSDDVPIEGYRAAARHILATTTPPTMADLEWDDEVHTGQCAEHPMYEVVRMISLDWEDDHAERILCYLRPGMFYGLPMSSLTPLPGTHLDMTPRREPESTPDHPKFLETEEDYENAPELPEANDPTASFVPDGKGWLLEGPTGPVVWTVPGGLVMIQRLEPGELTPAKARDLANILNAAADYAEGVGRADA